MFDHLFWNLLYWKGYLHFGIFTGIQKPLDRTSLNHFCFNDFILGGGRVREKTSGQTFAKRNRARVRGCWEKKLRAKLLQLKTKWKNRAQRCECAPSCKQFSVSVSVAPRLAVTVSCRPPMRGLHATKVTGMFCQKVNETNSPQWKRVVRIALAIDSYT